MIMSDSDRGQGKSTGEVIRHAVSLRGAAAVIPGRSLALFGMTLRVRLPRKSPPPVPSPSEGGGLRRGCEIRTFMRMGAPSAHGVLLHCVRNDDFLSLFLGITSVLTGLFWKAILYRSRVSNLTPFQRQR